MSNKQTNKQTNKAIKTPAAASSTTAPKKPIDLDGSDNQHIASYDHNGQGERFAKTVYADKTDSTSYSLYSEQRLAAETDSEGRITAHYVYLYGKPVAKIEMKNNTQTSHQFWKTITSLGGLIKPTEPDACKLISTSSIPTIWAHRKRSAMHSNRSSDKLHHAVRHGTHQLYGDDKNGRE